MSITGAPRVGSKALDRGALEAALGRVRDRIASLEVLSEVDSTSSHLARQAPSLDGRVRLCVAEVQTAGRGRRGRRWQAPPGTGITFSLMRVFPGSASELGPLALAAGVLVAETLRAHGVDGVGLKWPNDLVVDGAKLGGILVEVDGGAVPRAIVGVGLNHDRGDAVPSVDQPVTDIRRAASVKLARARLAGAVMGALVEGLDRFAVCGFRPFQSAWGRLDALAGSAVRVVREDGAETGIARGVAADGGLRVETARGLRVFHSGEVSVRAVP